MQELVNANLLEKKQKPAMHSSEHNYYNLLFQEIEAGVVEKDNWSTPDVLTVSFSGLRNCRSL
jgi:hypothetical protein